MYTEQDGCGGVPGWSTDHLCWYCHHTFICHKYRVKHTNKQCNLDCLKCDSKGRRHQRDANLCGACARHTDERSLVRDGRGYNQGSYECLPTGVWVGCLRMLMDWFGWMMRVDLSSAAVSAKPSDTLFSLQPATCFLAQCAKSFLVSACVDTGPVRAKGCCCCGGGRTGLVIGSKRACVCMQWMPLCCRVRLAAVCTLCQLPCAGGALRAKLPAASYAGPWCLQAFPSQPGMRIQALIARMERLRRFSFPSDHHKQT